MRRDEVSQPGAGDGVPLVSPDGGADDEAAAAASPAPAPPCSPKKKKKKRDANALRKAPQAPKRFKSSYIMYFTAKQDETKAELTREAEARGEEDVAAATTVTEISRRSADNWKHLPADERAYWEEQAALDKQRYMREKDNYTGPWQVPKKRAKKDPTAPKRPMSAFLYFSQERRKLIKAKNPGMKNTEVSVVLGKMWREASDEEKRPHMEIEEKERAKYKVKIAKWNEEKKERDEALKKEQEEQQRQFAMQPPPPPPPQAAPASTAPQVGGPYAMPPPQAPPPPPMQADPSQQQQQQQSPQQPPPPPQSYDPNVMYQQPPYGVPPPYPYHMYPPPPHGYYAPYPPPPNGQPVVLGPNGMPQGVPPPPQEQAAPHQQQHHMYMHPAQPAQSMPPPPQGQYPPPYGAPPPQHQQQHQEHHLQQQQQQASIPAAPPAHQVFNEDGNGNPMMPYPTYPEPEQLMGGQMQMPYPPQD